MKTRGRWWWATGMAAMAALGVGAQRAGKPRGPVVVLTVSGDVNPVLVSYLKRGLREGAKQKAELVVIRLDTPGGQLESTRTIAQQFLASETPVAVYVWPAGGRAGSAGTFITMGAHIAAMAPETNMGAAHPVMMAPEGEGPSADEAKARSDKATNDAAALIRNLAQKRGRDAVWAEKAVRQSVSATAEEAADLGAIDFVARDLPDLLAQADGKRVEVASGARVLHTRGARIEGLPMNWRERALFPIAHPNVAYILMILGVYGLILELKASGFSGAGILGAICIVLALFALSVLSVNVAGLALVLIGVGFFVAELFAPTHGLLTVGGAAALAVGSLILIDADSVQVSRPLIAGVVLATVVFFVFLLGAVVRGQRRKVVTGREGLIGQVGVARGPLNPEGTVFVDGTLWSAESAEGEVACGEKVEVVAVNGLRLTVRPAPAPGTPDAAQQPCEEGG